MQKQRALRVPRSWDSRPNPSALGGPGVPPSGRGGPPEGSPVGASLSSAWWGRPPLGLARDALSFLIRSMGVVLPGGSCTPLPTMRMEGTQGP